MSTTAAAGIPSSRKGRIISLDRLLILCIYKKTVRDSPFRFKPKKTLVNLLVERPVGVGFRHYNKLIEQSG